MLVPRPGLTWHHWLGRQVLLPVVGVIGMASLAAHAQDRAAPSGWFLQPSLSVRQTVTSNAGLVRGSDARADSITDISPGLRLSSRSGRIVGDLDYALHGLLYARRSSLDEVQQSLSAKGTAEAIDNWAYVEGSASISQQSISALGTRSVDRNLANSNRAEVLTYQLAPYVRGTVGSFANYLARWNWTSSNSGGSSAKSMSNDASFVLSSSEALFA
ncbi:MAG: TIGR03016 family PEP-CTERM system-associated outer membrane protein, partial [Burkholderiales bacterium]